MISDIHGRSISNFSSNTLIVKNCNTHFLNMFWNVVTVSLFAPYFVTCTDAFGDNVWRNLKATWPTSINKGPYNLPLTTSDAYNEGWTSIKGAEPSTATINALYKLNYGTVKQGVFDIGACLGYKNNPRFIIYFNCFGEPVAILIAFPVADSTNTDMLINYSNHSGVMKKTLGDVEYFAGTVWFRVDDFGNRKIWVEDSIGITEIPTNADKLVSETVYLKKKCIPTMGTHYYHTKSTTDCAYIYPWALLFYGEELIGLAYQVIGNTTVHLSRVWNENFSAAVVATVIPDAPECMLTYISEFGLFSTHLWFISDIKTLVCSQG